MNPKTRKVFSFRCYQDKELNFPQNYAEKTISHVYIQLTNNLIINDFVELW